MNLFALSLFDWLLPRKRWVLISGFLLAAFFSSQFAVGEVTGRLLEQAIGARVSVSRFYINLYPVKLGLYGIKIHNPKGFREPVLVAIPEIYFDMDPLGILKGLIHVREVRINIEEITIEKNAQGKINLNELIQKLNQSKKDAKQQGQAPAPGSPPPSENKGPGKQKAAHKVRTQVDKVMVSIGKARYVDTAKEKAVERSLSVNIQNFQLQNVTDPASVTEQIVVMMLKKLGLMAVNAELNDLQHSLENQAKAMVDQARQTLQSWFH